MLRNLLAGLCILFFLLTQQGAALHWFDHALDDVALAHAVGGHGPSSFSDVPPALPEEPCLSCLAVGGLMAMAAALLFVLSAHRVRFGEPLWCCFRVAAPDTFRSRARSPPIFLVTP